MLNTLHRLYLYAHTHGIMWSAVLQGVTGVGFAKRISCRELTDAFLTMCHFYILE